MYRLFLIALLGLSGCISRAVQHGNIVELDQTVFGFNLSASSAPNNLPAVQFGLIRSKVLFVPTSTNKVYAPQFSTTGELNNNGRTLLFGGQDASTSGDSVLVTNKPGVTVQSGASLLELNPAALVPSNSVIQVR